MIEVKTADLIGPALNWAAAKVERLPLCEEACQGDHIIIGTGRGDLERYSPSTNWAQCGPLIEKWQVDLYSPSGTPGPWGAAIQMTAEDPMYEGNSPLIAACRAIVAAKLGDVVSVPAELVQQP